MKKEHLHNEQMGYTTPKGYFEDSKKEMLAFLEHLKEEQKPSAFRWTSNVFAFTVFAALFIGIFYSNTSNIQDVSFEQLTIESLELSDEDFDNWFDENFVLNDV
jgi:hypothetical protein